MLALSRELQISRSVLYSWLATCKREGMAGLSRGPGRLPGKRRLLREPAEGEPRDAGAERVAELEQWWAGRQPRSGFKANLRASQRAAADGRRWRHRIYAVLREEIQREGAVTIGEGCELAVVSRAGFYRSYQEHQPRQADIELRDQIQRLWIEDPHSGYRRISRALQRQGCAVNAKRVLRLMRLDNLLGVRKKSFVLTTDSNHFLPVYPNLARRLVVDGLNQLWVADITYIRLHEQFLYLALILDAFSRRVSGWQLGESLEARLALAALEQALEQRRVEAGLIHHSDRGVRYCCREYLERLEEKGHFNGDAPVLPCA